MIIAESHPLRSGQIYIFIDYSDIVARLTGPEIEFRNRLTILCAFKQPHVLFSQSFWPLNMRKIAGCVCSSQNFQNKC